jgi:hypothetical protein
MNRGQLRQARGRPLGTLFAAALTLVASGACSEETNATSSVGTTSRLPCKTKADCSTYSSIDSQAQVCLLGQCTLESAGCTTPCSGARRGMTCVHSGILAHCDGCTNDSACLSPEDCETVTGHPCVPDLDAGPRPPVVEASPCPPGSCKAIP